MKKGKFEMKVDFLYMTMKFMRNNVTKDKYLERYLYQKFVMILRWDFDTVAFLPNFYIHIFLTGSSKVIQFWNIWIDSINTFKLLWQFRKILDTTQVFTETFQNLEAYKAMTDFKLWQLHNSRRRK